MLLAARRRTAGQEAGQLVLSDQARARPKDPQQAAQAQPLHALPPSAYAALNSGDGGECRQAPLPPPPHDKT